MNIKKSIAALCFILPTFSFANGSELSNASMALSHHGISNIVSGSSQMLKGGAQLSVASVQTVGHFSYITLRAVGTSAVTTIRVAQAASGHLLIASGQMVKVVTTSAGRLLTVSGKVIAFLPNTIGRSLLYSEVI